MEQTPIDRGVSGKAKRPVLLTVLCILTWIGSLVWIALEIYYCLTMKELANRFGIGFSFTHFYVIGCAVFVAGSLICMAGSLFMWQLRKIGFGLYVTGQLITVGFGAYLAACSGTVSWMYIVHTGVIVVFIVLYSRFLKVLGNA